MKNKRIGIFGGSFNPVHHGHLLLAREAKEALKLDEVVFIPCADSAYGKKLLPARLRLAMLRASLRGARGFRVDDIEIRRGGVSRSIDTLRALRAREGKGSRFYLLIGEDQSREFPRWKESAFVSKLSKVCVMARPGFRKAALIHKKFHFRTVKVSQYEISSTNLRQRLKSRLDISWTMPPKALAIFAGCRKFL